MLYEVITPKDLVFQLIDGVVPLDGAVGGLDIALNEGIECRL